jgi:septal ring factor EnvC (AmiA/AmiB activator)
MAREPPRRPSPRDGEAMTDASAIEAATRRLAAALDALEAALESRRDTDRGENALAAQVHALGSDRSKLASDLDTATARSRKLEATNREIAQRLDLAIDSIRSVIEAQP